MTTAELETAIMDRATKEDLNYQVRWARDTNVKTSFAERGVSFAAPLLRGGEFSLASALGKKPIVLTFWASWCKPCLQEAPQLAKLYELYTPRVQFIAVSIDVKSDYDSLRGIVDELKLPYPVALDPDGAVLAKYARGASIPITFVLGLDSQISFRHQNYQAGDEAKLEIAIKQSLGDSARRDEQP